jgi:hypothetical protein
LPFGSTMGPSLRRIICPAFFPRRSGHPSYPPGGDPVPPALDTSLPI